MTKKRTHRRRRRRFTLLRNPYATAGDVAERKSWVDLWAAIARFVHAREVAARRDLRYIEASRARRLQLRKPRTKPQGTGS